MDDGGPALFRLVRYWSRRWTRGVAVEAGHDASVPQHVLVVDAVDAIRRDGAEATVGQVAQQLGLDRSGASRMVAAAAEKGYLQQQRARSDARRSALALTAAGQDLLDQSHQWQRAKFVELTADWSSSDRTRFAGYLERLARDVGA
jgi:DNA-binding MarR family transcriptional regulator